MPDHDSPSTATNGIKSIDTTFRIVNELKKQNGAGITVLADTLGRSKSTIHSHLATLEEQEYVVKDGDTYHVGLRFLTLGGHARTRMNIAETAKPEIDDLAAETGETATVMTEEYGRGVYLYQTQGQQAVNTDSNIGTRVQLHCTAVGKAVLAHLDEERVETILDRQGLSKRTENTITDRETLRAELERIRERGYAFDEEERIEGIRCVAAPITIGDDDVLGALSVSGPTRRINGDRFEEKLPTEVTDAARVVEINMEYS